EYCRSFTLPSALIRVTRLVTWCGLYFSSLTRIHCPTASDRIASSRASFRPHRRGAGGGPLLTSKPDAALVGLMAGGIGTARGTLLMMGTSNVELPRRSATCIRHRATSP